MVLLFCRVRSSIHLPRCSPSMFLLLRNFIRVHQGGCLLVSASLGRVKLRPYARAFDPVSPAVLTMECSMMLDIQRMLAFFSSEWLSASTFTYLWRKSASSGVISWGGVPLSITVSYGRPMAIGLRSILSSFVNSKFLFWLLSSPMSRDWVV